MADGRDNLVLAMVRQLDSKADPMGRDIDRMGGDIVGLKTDMAAVKTELRIHTRTLNILLQEGRMVRAAVNDIARENVTPGEVEAIHHDLNQLRHDISALPARHKITEERARGWGPASPALPIPNARAIRSSAAAPSASTSPAATSHTR